MRLFACLTPPQWLAEHLAPALPPLPEEARAIPPQRWHLTLAFYGELDATGAACVERRLQQRLRDPAAAPGGRASALSLQVAGGSAFGAAVAYLAVEGAAAGDTARLRSIAEVCLRVGKACDAPGAQGRERFRPHITVARARRHRSLPADYTQRLGEVRSPVWTAERVELLVSLPGPQPRYDVVRSYPVAP